ncbi:flagellar basal-body rod protein FlgG [Chromobacterium amazonense]|uniref:Flagellar basal-body rod protein FlgG n=1 Tax=Chromobacterium amazonense TaxID=1382803 RepID=A0ABU8UWN3_9NEIS|nr:flagellar basal-body rod protein FlgG [Chromobacterium amazonense]KIA80379.1 flagellar basal body rod protein FlgG [Chromobacterium piscinae]MBM2883433.1 flagellar basal-body rod protein FlgG [Chromobacterium amazonense]MDE1712438.1 flagellar basal-body rod protein FlgG [Chromobacterium amazonense]MDQ4542622.1 flagellar basal-body rod protein FlgG [Chromobacterium amazonense]
MNPALWISKTGIQAQDARLTAIANNLANVNTKGFKRDRMVFEDMFYQVDRQPGSKVDDNNLSPSGVQLGNGTRLVGSQKVFTEGNLTTTNQTLDVAIVGQGFLQVKMSNGETGYTRAGELQLNADGLVVNAQGLPLEPEIKIPATATKISISETGVVSVTEGSATTPTDVGQITLANFVNPTGLLALGDNLFQETAASGNATTGNPGSDALGKLKQGSLEGSNVQVVEEMVDMIAAQRTYEMNTKVLSAADNMLQQLGQSVR